MSKAMASGKAVPRVARRGAGRVMMPASVVIQVLAGVPHGGCCCFTAQAASLACVSVFTERGTVGSRVIALLWGGRAITACSRAGHIVVASLADARPTLQRFR
jgi:hypothetical protein